MRWGLGAALLLALAAGSWASRPRATPIAAIQGASHISPLLGRTVTAEGLVTAVSGQGFYLQDPVGDGNPATSEGIFVEGSGHRPLKPGDRVRVTATVAESPTGGPPTGLLDTRLVRPTAVEVASQGNPLPAPVVIGGYEGGIPSGVIISPTDQPVDLRNPAQARGNRFSPDTDVLDFLESLENMRVTLRRPTAVSPSEHRGSGRSDFFAIPEESSPQHARTAAGGILLRSGPDNLGNQNPDRIKIAFDPSLHRARIPDLATGDRLGDVSGIMGYAYGAFQVSPVEPVQILERSGWRPEVTSLVRTPGQLAIASYNVLNLSADSSDERQRKLLGAQIARALRSPDIIALQEIQDASGERDDGVVDARPTLRELARAVARAGGPVYAYVDVPPANGRPGGAPGGNIRTAFFYDSSRVRLISHRSLTRSVLAAAGAPDPSAFAESRDPLEGVFEFRGQRITLINNHLTSRFGSTPVFGAVQPWVQAGETERAAQTRALHAYVRSLLDRDAATRAVVLGDMNTFELTDDLSLILPGDPPLLTNLISRVPEAQRYSYNFEGNSQTLDHILVTAKLAPAAEVDLVHLNIDFPSTRPASDHDPVVARFRP